MAKILNLDELQSPVDKSVVLGGVTHNFKPLTVAEFVDQLKEVEALEDAGKMKASEYIGYMVKIIRRGFPTITEEACSKLSTDQLKALSDFVKGESDADSEQKDPVSGE